MSAEACPVVEPEALAGSGPACFSVLSLFAEVAGALIAEQAKGDMVALSDVRRVLALVGSGHPVHQALGAQERRCRQAFRPSTQHATSRNDVFRRLMVRPFETLLEGDAPAFPRAFLRHYFEVIDAAFGNKLNHYEQRAREIFQEMLVTHGNELAWEVFFNDPRSHAVLSHALHRLVRYLESPIGQWAWLTCMGRVNVDGARPTSEQAALVLKALRETAAGLTPIHPPRRA